MVRHQLGMHHFHKRIRKKKKSAKLSKKVKLLDNLIYVVAFAGPIMTLPQVLKIWVEKEIVGVSLLSWAAFFIFSIIWVVYAMVHKDKPLLISSGLWIIVDMLIVVGLFIN